MNIPHFEAKPLKDWWKAYGLRLIGVFVLVLLPLYLFGVLAEDVIEKENIFFDQPVLRFVHARATPVLDSWMIFFSRAGSGLVLVPFDTFIFTWLLLKKQRREAFFWGLAVGGASLINFLAKLGFSRARPSLWIPLMSETTFSFPSGHAMQSMALATTLVILFWHTRWQYVVLLLSVSFVIAVGLSRIYLGVHYPSDVLAGWCASVAWVGGLRPLVMNRELFKRLSPTST